DGLYDGNPKTSSKAELIVEVNRSNYIRVLKGLKPTSDDVTGGMRGKVLQALRLAKNGCESYIFISRNRETWEACSGDLHPLGQDSSHGEKRVNKISLLLDLRDQIRHL